MNIQSSAWTFSTSFHSRFHRSGQSQGKTSHVRRQLQLLVVTNGGGDGGGGSWSDVFDPTFEAQVASELRSYFTLPSLLSSFVLCRCIRARALPPPQLFNGAFVPPDSRKQPAPNLSNSLWKQQRRPLFLLRAGQGRRLPDMAPAPDAAASLCRCFSTSLASS